MTIERTKRSVIRLLKRQAKRKRKRKILQGTMQP